MDNDCYIRQNGLLKSISEHLKLQGKRALNDEGNCAYRGRYGQKCAVGVLIRDEFYNPSCETATLMRHAYRLESEDSEYARNLNAKADILDESLIKSGVKSEDFPMLSRCQEIHDAADETCIVGDWWEHVASRLKEMAEDLGLDPKVIPA